MTKFHTAKEMLKAAAAAGFTIKIYGDPVEEPDYVGHDPIHAWEAVENTGEATMTLRQPDGGKVPGGWAYMMADGPGTCAPQETVWDCAGSGWANDWWEANRDAILA
jgi:hypothetical protein